MVRKAVDSRIPALIRNGVQEKKRSFIVVVGDRSKDVIVHLHYIMSSMDVKQNKSVLWAYKNKLLGFTSHRKKRELKIKKDIKRGIREANNEDPFELFVSLHDIRYVYYKETEKILGNTYGMCILQDFEAITPNLLARTIETVEGGGLVVLLLKGMSSLKQLYTLSMDVHSRYRTEAHDDVTARFNERFILSLGSCESCLVIDDELNVLPISGGKNVKALPPPDLDEPKTEKQKELDTMKDTLQDTQPVGSLITLAKTVDQAKALLTFVDAIAEKTLKSTVTLTAARGRGKSAALGVAVAAAVAHGYSNIFITSPSPENLKTLFEFIFKGFDSLGYMDHVDYSIIQSTNPDFNKAIVRVNVHRQHRQTIQYIRPQDAHVLGQAELLVIDEAAAIPLPLVRKLMGPYLVFMASTINGYEGTGRSLSLKLIKQLREQSRGTTKSTGEDAEMDRTSGKAIKSDNSFTGGRSLREITLSEPIRYTQGDLVEKWLNNLLYDLQLMSDAPAHQLFVLVPPVSEDSARLPEPLVVIQIALEGQISKQSVLNSLARGRRAPGDLIPWLVSQQFQDEDFAGLSGARIVRIATNPDYIGMGYGARAIELLNDFYEGKFANLSEDAAPLSAEQSITRVTDEELANATLLDDDIKVRDIRKMPPLFSKLTERQPDNLDYIGVSYGLTQPLHKFWKRSQFVPVYLRQTANDLTGEHTCVMLRPLQNGDDKAWLGAFARDYHKRFLSLLSYQFRDFASITALSIDESARGGFKLDPEHEAKALVKTELDGLLSPFDLKRLESYANNMLDYHVVLDLIPTLAALYFTGRLPVLKLTGVQAAILLAVGLQRKDLTAVESELNLPSSQLLAMFIKIMRKLSSHFGSLVTGAIDAELPKQETLGVSRADASAAHDDEIIDERFVALETNLEDELEEGGDEAMKALREKQRELIDALPLDQYEIASEAPGWAHAEQEVLKATKKGAKPSAISVKTLKAKRKAGESAAEIYEEEMGDKKKDRGNKKAKTGKKH
ncbi:hypothetical protein VE04_05502 [Pseudogymnoascus sp. 24MN13]|nr:hypothetical protein VE04_05502 [Pseudogymnoascus sp. 24MN13]